MKNRIAAALLLATLAATGCAKQTQGPQPAPAQQQTQPSAATGSKESLNDQAFAQIQAKNWSEAIKLAAQAVALDGNWAPARFNLGLAYYRAGHTAEAKPHLEAAYTLNSAQVEPGWFYALTLEALKQPAEALTVLKDLQARFPSDADVKQAIARLQPATYAGPVVWKRLPDSSWFLFLGDSVIQSPAGGQSLQGTDPTGKVLWTQPLGAPVAALAAHPSGRMVLALLPKGDAVILDAGTGELLARTNFGKLEDPNGKGIYIAWQGDMLYIGDDRWMATANGGGRWAFTVWQGYSVMDSGGQVTITKTGEAISGQQHLALSPDGRRVLNWWPAVGQSADLYENGQKGTHYELASGFTADGTGVFFTGYDGAYMTFGPNGVPLLKGKAPAEVPQVRYWPRPDGTWFVATCPPNEGYLLLNGTTATTPVLQGTVVQVTGRSLVINMGQELHVLTALGQTVLAVPARWADVTPDGRWLYVTAQTDITAYRLP
jgi:tetratricopeptide (TPR) repeat protein